MSQKCNLVAVSNAYKIIIIEVVEWSKFYFLPPEANSGQQYLESNIRYTLTRGFSISLVYQRNKGGAGIPHPKWLRVFKIYRQSTLHDELAALLPLGS